MESTTEFGMCIVIGDKYYWSWCELNLKKKTVITITV